MTQLTTTNSRKPSWKQLKTAQTSVQGDYYLLFPDSFSMIETMLDNASYGFYWKMRNCLFRNGGFMPYDVRLIRDYTHCRSIKSTEALLDNIMGLEEFDIIDAEALPEFFKRFLVYCDKYWKKTTKVLVNRSIMEAVEYGAKNYEEAVKNGCRVRNKKDACEGGLSETDTEGDRDTKAEKGPAEKKSSGQFGFAGFRDLWNEWAGHYGIERFEKLTDKKRCLFEARQRNFAKQGAYGEEFWVKLLSAVSEYGNGFYIGNNDGYNHNGRPWRVTFEWLMLNDDRVEKFIEAVA